MSSSFCLYKWLCIHLVGSWLIGLSSAFSDFAKERLPSPGTFAGSYEPRSTPLQPPFPDGPNGGQVITIPGVYDDITMLPSRDVQVWLPPEYDRLPDDVRFPVLYCHDGQNAMDDESSWTGASWRLMGAINRLSERRLLRGPSPIVVLLPSAEGDLLPGVRRRHLEYGSPTVPFAQAHADLVANTIKPLVDSQFRTDPLDASAIGSSMGGQASIHLLLRHPDIFRAAGCLSPYFSPETLAAVGFSQGSLNSKRVYMDIGGDVGDSKVPWVDLLDHLTPKHWWNPGYFWLDTSLQPSVDAMQVALQIAGVETMYEQIPGGRHNERAWALRIHKPLMYLYGKR